MNTILKVAWRNIWRNKTRSFTVMGAVIIGIWSIIFLVGMVNGLVKSYVENAIKNEISHLKIQHPEFIKNKESLYNIPKVSEVLKPIDSIQGIKAVCYRTVTNTMINSGHSGRGVTTIGVVPSVERNVSGIQDRIIEGTYLSDDSKNKILISRRMADKLKVKLRSKVVLTFQNLDRDISMGAFRVVGIFKTNNNMYDDMMVFVRLADINRIMGTENMAHEVAVLIDDLNNLEPIQNRLKTLFPEYLVRNYKEIQPELALFQHQIELLGIIYMVIFMAALIFGIINTMMMAVLERVKELGMLMAVGMNRTKVFMMIVLETLLLAMIAAPIGLILGYLTNAYYYKNGLNLFFYSEKGMQQFGFDNLVYPEVPTSLYWQLVVAITLTALIGSLYPAWKAISLNPVEAIRGRLISRSFKFYKKLLTSNNKKSHV